jgi:hypothetical protein
MWSSEARKAVRSTWRRRSGRSAAEQVEFLAGCTGLGLEPVASAGKVRWSELAGFVRRDDRFLGFIVRHIDETIPATTVDSIERNAREKCPASARNICQTVLKACKDLRERVKEEKDGGR